METDGAQRIANELTDAAYLMRHDPSDLGGVIAGIESVLTQLRAAHDRNVVAEHHGYADFKQ